MSARLVNEWPDLGLRYTIDTQDDYFRTFIET